MHASQVLEWDEEDVKRHRQQLAEREEAAQRACRGRELALDATLLLRSGIAVDPEARVNTARLRREAEEQTRMMSLADASRTKGRAE